MGYLGLHRQIRDHWIYKDSQYYHVWSEMLFRARYSEESSTKLHEGELVTVGYGEFIFGRISWERDLKVSQQRLRTLIKKLLDDDMLVLIKVYRKCSVYKVKNYEKYNHQSNHQPTLEQQGFESDTNHQSNSTPTTNQPPANHQPTTKEQSNKGNKVKKDKDTPSKMEYAEMVFLNEKEVNELIAEFGENDFKYWVMELSDYSVRNKNKPSKLYTDHARTIRNWIRREERKKLSKPIISQASQKYTNKQEKIEPKVDDYFAYLRELESGN